MVNESLLATPLMIGSVAVRNRVFLAPMSGITDSVFRSRAFDHGAGLVVSEMVASGELAKGRAGSRRRLTYSGKGIHMVQLAGREASAMAETARIAAGEGARIIDINMGCPAKKVTGGYSGSALMRDLDHAVCLIDAVVAAVDVPVTVKMRLGWDDCTLNAPTLAHRAENAGVCMVTVHGRTRCQFYNGKADWGAIRRVKEAVTIPVVANGDVATLADSRTLLDVSGADAVMVGRASFGAPWTPGQIVAASLGASCPGRPDTAEALADYVIEHYEAMLSLYGLQSGLRQARKHLGWYLEAYAPSCPASLRSAILRFVKPAEVSRAVRQAFMTEVALAAHGMAA